MMKNIRKHLPLLALTFLLAVAAVLTVPSAAEAAKPKTKSATVSVKDTKISGMEYFDETVSLNDKYVIAFGWNSKGKNFYAYSKNGTTFSKAKSLGLDGDIYCRTAGKHLYVLGYDEDTGELAYKYVTDPAKLSSTKAVEIGYNINKIYNQIETCKFVKSSGKLYMLANYKSTGDKLYLVTLNKTHVSVQNYKIDQVEKTGYKTHVQWVGDKICAYNTKSNVLESSGGKPVYYIRENGKWKKKKAPMKSSKGFRVDDEVVVSVNTTGKEVLCLIEKGSKPKIGYTTNGSKWKTLPAVSGEVNALNKTKSGTFVEVWKDKGDGSYTYYQLKSGKWKKLTTVAPDEWGEYYGTNFNGKQPTAILSGYIDDETTIGYNLATGKSYTLPFYYMYNCLFEDKTEIYADGKLYATKDAYKTITVITLKAGSKKLEVGEEGIRFEEATVKGKDFLYFQDGNKVYGVSRKALLKAVK